MPDARVQLIIEAMNRTDAAFNDMKKNLRRATEETRSFTTKASAMVQNLRQHWMALTAATAAVTIFAKKSVDAFMEQEAAENALAVAMKNFGDYTAEAHRELVEYAAALQKATTYGDETTISVMANLKSYGMTTEELKKATVATMDLATAKKIDLRTASELVGKAFVGETGTLSRYGIVLEDGLKKSEKFAAVLMLINDRFGGAAQAEIETYGGKLGQLSNWWSDITEKIGYGLVRAIEETMKVLKPLRDMVEETTTAFAKMSEEAEKAAEKTQDIKPPDKTTWNEFWAFMDKWGTLMIRWVSFLGKTVGDIFALIVGDAIEAVKMIGHNFWSLGKIIWNALTFSFDEVKEEWVKLLSHGLEYNRKTELNWIVTTERIRQNWKKMIDEMLGKGELLSKQEIKPPPPPPVPHVLIEKTKEYQELLERGILIAEDYSRAHWMAMEEAGVSWGEWISKTKEYQDLLERGMLIAEDYGRAHDLALQQSAESIDEVKGAARDLGFTFSSAFENAIVEGKKLREVIKGLAQDILRILTRTWITEPMAKGVAGVLSDIFHKGRGPGEPAVQYRLIPAGAFAGAPRFHGGRGGEIPAILREDEWVFTPGQLHALGRAQSTGVNITQHIAIDARGADPGVVARINEALQRNKEETKAEILDSMHRGGTFARFGRR